MVGSVGAVNMPPIGRAKDAVADAFHVIRGWDEKERKPIQQWLEQLLEAIAENKAVYDQAANAANANSVKDRDLRKLQIKVDTEHKLAAAAARHAEAGIADAWKSLKSAQASQLALSKAFDAESLERGRGLAKRETATKARELKLNTIEAVQQRRATELTADERAANNAQSHIDKIAAQLRSTLSQLGEK